ncbi:hypothetical protein [Candidatus Borrarchaeum sp.]|uniref:hypothetical protein n=1 Tax=Candidatus Borrarchaeum sp. TaxID=2846742 RepID=UPI00257AD402|nr:hypothetical protein [Candidatus Borrarchaeum sp.]
MSYGEVAWEKLLVVILFIGVIIYFPIIFFGLPVIFTAFGVEVLDDIFTITALVTFILGWILLIYIYKDSIASGFSGMGRAVEHVPKGVRLFYIVNITIAFVFFFMPLFTPLIVIVVAFLVAGRIMYPRSDDYGDKRGRFWIFTLLLFVILMIIPILQAYDFYVAYFIGTETTPGIARAIWNIWTRALNPIHIAVLCVADAAAIGAFITLIYEGARQVDPHYVTEIPDRAITFLEILILLTFGALWFLGGGLDPDVVGAGQWLYERVLHFFALGLAVLTWLIRFFKGLRTHAPRDRYYIMGILGMIVLYAADYIAGLNPGSTEIRMFLGIGQADPGLLTIGLLFASFWFGLIFFVGLRSGEKQY